jgi:hypothetical protein
VESPILIDIWTVESSRRAELVHGISDLMHNVVLGCPGFVSAEIYESVDGGSVLSTVRMRSVEERQGLMDSREAREGMRGLRAIAQTHARLYRLVESFGDAS